MKKVLKILLLLVLLVAMAKLVAKRKKEAQAVRPYSLHPLAVHVAKVTRQDVENTHSYLGVVEAWQSAAIASRLSARIDDVLYDEGDAVKAGELLVHLDDSDIRAQIKAVESTIQGLKSNHDFWVSENRRDSELVKQGVISKVEAETTRNRMADAAAKLETARRNLDSLRTKIAYTRLTSPFAGVVTSRLVDPGNLAVPGRTLMVVEDHNAVKIAFDAPQEDMLFLKTGLPVEATLGGKTKELRITHIYPSLDRSRMVRVEIKLSGAGATIGSFIPLKVIWRQHENAVTVPRESLMRRGPGDWVVFTVVDGRLALRPVQKRMESTRSGRVEVEGVEPGEQVVTSTFLGWANLAENLEVEVVQ